MKLHFVFSFCTILFWCTHTAAQNNASFNHSTESDSSALNHNSLYNKSTNGLGSATSLYSGVIYNPFIDYLSQEDTQYNYWISAQSSVVLGGVPIGFNIAVNSNSRIARLGDIFSINLDGDTTRKQYADIIRRRILGRPEFEGAIHRYQSIVAQQSKIEEALNHPELLLLNNKDLLLDGIDSLEKTIEKHVSVRDSLDELSKLASDSVELYREALEREEQLIQDKYVQLAHLSERAASIDVHEEVQHYHTRLKDERNRLDGLASQIEDSLQLDTEALEVIRHINDPKQLLQKYGRNYLTKGQQFLSSIEQMQIGRFQYSGSRLTVPQAALTGGDITVSLKERSYRLFSGNATLIDGVDVANQSLSFGQYWLLGAEVENWAEHRGSSISILTLTPHTVPSLPSSPLSKNRTSVLYTVKGMESWVNGLIRFTYEIAAIDRDGLNDKFSSPVFDPISLIDQTAANLALIGIWLKERSSYALQVEHIGSRYEVPGNFLLSPSTGTLQGYLDYRPSERTKLGINVRNERVRPVLSQQSYTIKQAGITGEAKISKHFRASAQFMPYVKSASYSEVSNVQIVASIDYDHKVRKCPISAGASYTRNGLNVVSTIDSFATYIADCYTFTNSIGISPGFQVEIVGSLYKDNAGFAKEAGGSLVVRLAKPQLMLKASSIHYWNHPLFDGPRYQIGALIKVGKYEVQLEGQRRNERIQHVAIPVFFVTTLKYNMS